MKIARLRDRRKLLMWRRLHRWIIGGVVTAIASWITRWLLERIPWLLENLTKLF